MHLLPCLQLKAVARGDAARVNLARPVVLTQDTCDHRCAGAGYMARTVVLTQDTCADAEYLC